VSYAGFIDNLVGVWAKSEASPFDSKALDKSVLRALKFEPICPNPSWAARARVTSLSSEVSARRRPLTL
jgi:hypothetical protein